MCNNQYNICNNQLYLADMDQEIINWLTNESLV